MGCLDRYIAWKLLQGWILVWLVMSAIFGLLAFIEELDRVTEHYQTLDALQFVLYTLPQRSMELAPVIILLGSLRGPHDAGIYAIVARAAAFVVFLSAAANMVLAPRIAALYRVGDMDSLQRLLTAASRRVFFISLPLAIVFLVAARPLLVFLYGADYAGGAWPLTILTLGYLSTLFAGFTVVVANMTGHEKATLVSIGISLGLNIVLNLALIPIYGMKGSAIATGTSLVAFNAFQWLQVRRRIGLGPSVLGF